MLGPEDMTNPHVDELSMMTYLSQFPDAELKEGAPIGSQAPPAPPTDITKVKVGGPGITGNGAQTGKPAPIEVDCNDSGVAPISAIVTGPDGKPKDINFKPSSSDPNKFEGSYVPDAPGVYNVDVKFDDESLPEAPFKVAIGDPSAVRLDGEGLERAFVGKEHDNVIDVYTENAGPGDVTADFKSPPGAGPVDYEVKKIDDNHHQICYHVDEGPGNYEADVLFNGVPVESQPRVIPSIDLSKVIVSGPGIESGNPAKSKTTFDVDARRAGGPADLKVSITDPDNQEVPINIEEIAKNAYRITYTPEKEGNHTIDVQYADKELKDSPYKVVIDEPGYVKCMGDGLHDAIANVPAHFVVDATKAGEGSLGLQMEGPAEVADVKCEPGPEPGTFNVTYTAPKPGAYKINVKFNDEPVPGAPFEVSVKSGRGDPDASKCLVKGLENPGSFEVDCKNAGGTGHLEVGVSGAYVPADYIAVKHNGDYTFSVSYHISDPGETTITVKWHGKDLEGSPFIIQTQ